MEHNRWHEIEQIFDEALEHDEAERPAFLAQACQGDAELRREVESLLRADEQVGSFIASPLLAVSAAHDFSPSHYDESPSLEGARIGAYQIEREIARGGMGTVYLATRADDQYHQQVAIKLLKAGANHSDIAGRLRHERQILADLNHPNIARLLDGGTTESGQPYLVMEYIAGVPIDAYCRDHQLTLRERLQLFRQVCAAVAYAHQHLIIHRDLKPANILVTADGTPKLLDFGIAKLLQPDLSQSYQTQAGQTPMTPAYASPEQVRSEKLTTTSDVYSLGVVLYELLTGRSPYQLWEHSFSEMIRAITEQEPERPSTAGMKDEATHGNRMHSSIHPSSLRGDVDSIVLMALRKEPTARYASVEQFSADIQRYLGGLPTLARKSTFAYRAVKYVRRYKVTVAAAALILLSLLGGISATLRQAAIAKVAQFRAEGEQSKADAQRLRAENALATAEERRQQAEAARREADQQRAAAELQKTFADEQRARAEQEEQTKRQFLYAAQMKLAHQAWDPTNSERTYNIERMQELLDAQLPQPGQQDLRGFEWYYLWRLARSELVTLQHTAQVMSIVLTPDGTKMASQTLRGDLRIWETATGKELAPIHANDAIACGLAISPDGKFFAQSRCDGKIKIFAVSNGAHLSMLESGQRGVTNTAFSPDGRFLAASMTDGMVGVWAVPTWKREALFKASSANIYSVIFTPDSKELLTGGQEGLIKVWHPLNGQERRTLPNKMTIYRMTFIPGSNNVVGLSTNGVLKTWNFATGQQVAEIKIASANALACSPDGKIIATAHTDPIVRLWNAQSGTLLTEIKTHGRPLLSLAFTPDGKGLFTGSVDKTIKFRNVQEVSDAKLIAQNTTPIHNVAFTRDGRRLISGDEAQVIRIHDARTGRELQKIEGHEPVPRAPNVGLRMLKIAVSPAGGYFATSGHDKTVRTWDEQTGRPLQVFRGHTQPLWAIDISADGRFIASGGLDSTVKIWDTVSGRELHTMRGHTGNVGGAAFSPLGKILATCDLDKVIIWDYRKGIELTSIKSESPTVGFQNVDFSPDGKFLAVSDADRKIVLLDTTTWRTVKTLKGHTQTVFTLKFSPDGKRLASGGRDATTRVWELEQGQEVLTLRGHETNSIIDMRFSPDGTSLATVGMSGKLLLWNAATPREVLAYSSPGNHPLRATVSAADWQQWLVRATAAK